MNRILKRWRPSLFLRIFLVAAATVLGAQALNICLIFAVPLPEPTVYPLSDIAAALRSGQDPSDALEIAIGAPPPESGLDERDREVGIRLAAQLNVDSAMVKIADRGPPRLTFGKGGPILFAPPRPRARVFNHDFVVGSFAAAMALPDGQWRVVRPREPGLGAWELQILLWLSGVFAVVTPVAWLAARRAAIPIKLLAEAAERFAKDPSSPPMAMKGPPEILATAQTLNDMRARLKRYVDDRTTMVAAIAHDLRTPLMRLSLYLDDLPAETRGAAETEIREMKERIQATLSFVRDVNSPVRRQRMNLRSLIETISDERMDQGANVVVEPGDDLVIDGDVASLKALFDNLVDNAVRYANGARIILGRERTHATIAVEDDGPGIPTAELERVFQPFYRIDASRNRETGGTGLGLASARAVARAHGGDVVLSHREGGGLVAHVTLRLN